MIQDRFVDYDVYFDMECKVCGGFILLTDIEGKCSKCGATFKVQVEVTQKP